MPRLPADQTDMEWITTNLPSGPGRGQSTARETTENVGGRQQNRRFKAVKS
jgi:hypothetical protein